MLCEIFRPGWQGYQLLTKKYFKLSSVADNGYNFFGKTFLYIEVTFS